MSHASRLLARTLGALIALTLLAPSAAAMSSAESPAAPGEMMCCTGTPGDMGESPDGLDSGMLVAGGPCIIICAGAVATDSASTGGVARQEKSLSSGIPLRGHTEPPEPFPPKPPLYTG